MTKKIDFFDNTVGLTGISANGTVGTAGQVLKSNGTTTYWDADSASGGDAATLDGYDSTAFARLAASNIFTQPQTISLSPTSGPTIPTGTLVHIIGNNDAQSRLFFDVFGSNAAFLGRRANGSNAVPAQLVTNDIIFTLGGFGYFSGATSGYAPNASALALVTATENFTDVGRGAKWSWRTTTNGTITPVERWHLDHDGSFRAEGLTATGVGTVNAIDYFDNGININTIYASLAATNTFTGNVIVNKSGVAVPTAFGLDEIRIVGAATRDALFWADSFGGPPVFGGRRAEGVPGTPTAVQSGNTLVALRGYGYGTSAYSGSHRGSVSVIASENWSDIAQGTRIVLATTPNAGAAQSARWLVENDGSFIYSGGSLTGIAGTINAIDYFDNGTNINTIYGSLALANIFTQLQTINLNTSAALPAAIAPTSIHIGALDGNLNRALFDSFGSANSIAFRRANNTNASKAALALNDVIGNITAFGYQTATGSYSTVTRATIAFAAAEPWTDTAQGTRITFTTTTNTTATGLARWGIENDGSFIYSGGSVTGNGTINAIDYFDNGTNINTIYASLSGATFTGAVTAPSVTMSGTAPFYAMTETDADANETRWRMTSIGGDFWLIAYSDDFATNSVPVLISRTGTTIDSIAFTSSALTWRGPGAPVFTNTTDTANNYGLYLDSDRATPTNADSVSLGMRVSSSSGVQREIATIRALATSVANGSETSRIDFSTILPGNLLAQRMTLNAASLVPYTNDSAALGTTTNMWSDLFLASGAVINFNNGDVLVTHSADTLAFTGAASGYSFDNAFTVLNSAAASTFAIGFNGAFSSFAYISSAAGQLRNIIWRTGSSQRWVMGTNSVAESGANAGSNFSLESYDDASTLLGTVFSVTRSSRVLNFNVAPTFTDAATTRTNLGLAIGTNVQAWDTDLDSWAGVARASGFDAFVATPTSANLKTLVTDETGSGALVFANTPTLVTPALGAATATSINGLTLTSSTGTLTITNAKTFSVSNTLTLSGTDTSTLNIGGGGTLASAAYVATGTTGATIPLLNGTNVWNGVSNAFNYGASGASQVFVGASNAQDAYLYLRANAAQTRSLVYQTGTTNRWQLYADTVAESGSSAGSNFHLRAYDDAGASLGDAFSIVRATRVVTFPVAPTFTDAATTRTNLGLAIGTNVQAWDADLDSWAGVVRASGFDTFVAAPSGANFAALLTTALPVSRGGTNATTAGIAAFNNITGYTAAGATGTTSTNLVFSTSPTLVTPVLGAATATSINGLTLTSSTGTLTITNAKTFSVTNTLTLSGTDTSTLNIGGGGTLGSAAYKNTGTTGNNVALLDGINTWSGAQTFLASAAATTLVIGGAVDFVPALRLTSNAGQDRRVNFFTSNTSGTTIRWSLLVSNAAESGSNAGSNFSIQRFDDAGTFIDQPFAIARNTGGISLNAATTISTTGTGALLSVTSSDAGATAHGIDISRNSASPAVNDVVGQVRFLGKDSGATTISYGRVYTTIVDPTVGSLDSSMLFDAYANNVSYTPLTLGVSELEHKFTTTTSSIVSSQGTNGYGSFYAKGSGTNPAYMFFGNTSVEYARITVNSAKEFIVSSNGGTANNFKVDSSGVLTANGNIIWHAGNDGDGTALDAGLLSSYNHLKLAYGNRANRSITGGGTITVNASGYVLWSTRFIVISSGRGTSASTSGYFDINCPTSGTITGVGGAASVTADATGIPLAAWQALYYILPIGSNNTSLAANFRVVSYTADVDIPHDWVLICVRNGDSGVFYFNNGIQLKVNSVHTVGTVWNSGNDGAGSGADADTVDGINSSQMVYGINQSGSTGASATQTLTELAQYKSGFWDVVSANWTPDTGYWWGLTMAHTSNGPSYNYGGQIAIQNSGGTPTAYLRSISGGATPAATTWQKIWTSETDGATSGLNADLLDDYHESSFWRVSTIRQGDYSIARASASNDVFGGLEIRENGLVGNAQTDATYAPGINFHWGNIAAARIYMNASGQFVFGGQTNITTNRRDLLAASIYSNGNLVWHAGNLTVGTSGSAVPQLNAINTWSALQTMSNLTARVTLTTAVSGTLTSAHANISVELNGNVTLNNSVFTPGDKTVFDPGTASRTFTRGTGVTMYVNGVDSATATLAANQIGGMHWRTASVVILTGAFT